MSSNTPNPGSPEAVKMGCECPVMDNCRGRGAGSSRDSDNPVFWINGACPIHGLIGDKDALQSE